MYQMPKHREAFHVITIYQATKGRDLHKVIKAGLQDTLTKIILDQDRLVGLILTLRAMIADVTMDQDRDPDMTRIMSMSIQQPQDTVIGVAQGQGRHREHRGQQPTPRFHRISTGKIHYRNITKVGGIIGKGY